MHNRETIRIMCADFDKTMAGHGVNQTAPHRLNQRLIDVGKEFDEVVVVTKREVKNSYNRCTYQHQLMGYLKAKDLHGSADPSKIVVYDDANKEHVGDITFLKSAMITSALEVFIKLTNTVLVGVSMAQDASGDSVTGFSHTYGFGYTYEQFAKPYEIEILEAINCSGGQISLRAEKTLQQSNRIEETKNSQLRQVIDMLRKRHGDYVHCDIGFYDDRLDICRAAGRVFKSDELLTFKVYYVTRDEIIELAAYEKREQEKHERWRAANPVVYSSRFDPFGVNVSLNVTSSKSDKPILSVATISSLEQLYVLLNKNKPMFVSKRSYAFFRKSEYTFSLQGSMNYGYILQEFNSFESLYNMLINKYVFDRYSSRLSVVVQIERWQRQLKYARMSYLKRFFLQQWLGMLKGYVGSYNTIFPDARDEIDGVLLAAVLYNDDRFFSDIENMLNVPVIPIQLYKDTMQLVRELRAEQAVKCDKLNYSVSTLLLICLMAYSYNNPEIGISLMTLLVFGHQAEMFSLDPITHRAMEYAETTTETSVIPLRRI